MVEDFEPPIIRRRKGGRNCLSGDMDNREAQTKQHKGNGILRKLLFAALALSPLRKQTLLVVLMLFGFGMMLVVAGSDSDTAQAVLGWGVFFIASSALLLVGVSVAAIGERLFGVVARDVKSQLVDENSKDASDPPTLAPDDDGLSD